MKKGTQTHLKKVYAALAIAMLCAGAGATLYVMVLFQGLLLSFIGSIACIIGLAVTRGNHDLAAKRLGMLCGFGFCSGTSMGPLIQAVIEIDPSIVPTAFLGTCVVFVCLSLASLLSQRRSWLFLAGPLMSGLSLLFFMSIFGMLTGSSLGLQVQLYLGLLVFCGFVLFDTQLIVEKKERLDDDDYIWHSVDLFIDFIAIFQRLLVILASKEKKKNNKR